MIYGYIRVSTEEQNLENQKKAISEKWQVENWVEEKKSGTIDIYIKPLPPLTEKPRKHGHPTYRELEYFRNHS